VPTPKIREFEAGLYRFLEQNHPDLLPAIASEKSISDASQDALKSAVTAFRRDAGYGEDARTEAPADAEDTAGTDDEASTEGASDANAEAADEATDEATEEATTA
jgi:hypothetical protein